MVETLTIVAVTACLMGATHLVERAVDKARRRRMIERLTE